MDFCGDGLLKKSVLSGGCRFDYILIFLGYVTL